MTDTQKTLLAKQTRYESNRKNFAETMDAVTRGQRGGLFSLPLGNTIGDSSTYYVKDRKENSEVGKNRCFANTRGRITTSDPFNKLSSNAIGDPYQDAGKYHLRQEAGKRALSGPFNPSGKGNKLLGPIQLTDEKEFILHQAGPNANSTKWLATKTHSGGFTTVPYVEDAFERKEDMRRLDYKRRAQLILNKEMPFTSTVKQHGTFEPMNQTYGNDSDFPKKYIPANQKELFGPFRIGNLPKKGHEKTLTPFPRYIEDPPDDSLPK